jgi:carbamoyl-phosphate synthase/aspartate carbamoyltransferase/dihydroorotase
MKIIKLPGLIDIHVHLRDPGQTEKEDFSTGSRAALAGGFTTICDMPNNKIPIFTYERLMDKIERAKKTAQCNIYFYFGTLGDNFAEFEKIYQHVVGLKLYLDNTTGGFILNTEKLLSVYNAWKSEKPILLHCEDEHIKTLINIVRQTKKKTHICHIHSRVVLEAIIAAKKEGLPITCGVTPHHLFLTKEDEKRLGTYGLMKPPLPSKEDNNYLWDHLADIDVVESDHAPHTTAEKQSRKPPFGVPGLETTLPLLLDAVNKKRLIVEDIIRLCYDGPRKILNLKESKETVVVDMDAEYIIKGSELKTKCKWTPFEGMKVKGKILQVIQNNNASAIL